VVGSRCRQATSIAASRGRHNLESYLWSQFCRCTEGVVPVYWNDSEGVPQKWHDSCPVLQVFILPHQVSGSKSGTAAKYGAVKYRLTPPPKSQCGLGFGANPVRPSFGTLRVLEKAFPTSLGQTRGQSQPQPSVSCGSGVCRLCPSG
jgi:hypothetical protein